MAVPKRKVSPSRRGNRRSHDKLKTSNIVANSKTGEPQRSHFASVDGFYRGVQVFITKAQKRIMKAEDLASQDDSSEEVATDNTPNIKNV